MATHNGEARSKILHAADELFGDLGFEAATTRQISERSGVNKALIHYHFKNKHELFGAVLDRYYQRLDRVMRQRLLEAQGDLRERLLAVVDAYVDFLRDNQSFSRMVQREAAGKQHHERVMGHMRPLFQAGAQLIEGQFPAARGGDLAAPQLLISFYGMIVSYFTFSSVLEELFGDDPLSSENLAARKRHLSRMVDLVLQALQAEPAS